MGSIFIFLVVLGLQAIAASPPLQIDLNSPLDFGGRDANFSHLFAGVRISRDLIPLHYDLEIRPILTSNDPDQFTAPGRVTILLRVDTPTDNVTLHANDMSIDYDNVQIRQAQTGIAVRILSHGNSSAMSTYTALLETELVLGTEYELTIPFIAKVGDRMSGLYRSSYLDNDGVQVWLATTQFQKLGARMAFPCFDEPSFKSTFNITIGRAEGYHTLSNGALEESLPISEMPGWWWDVHSKTVPMPTYLIAMIVSDFVSLSAPEGISDYDIKVWGPGPITNEASAGFAATVSAQITTFFENYLESPYQFPKLDSVAVPDFSAGAMENWALNTYRLYGLLFVDGESTQNDKRGIATVFAHEISHHWFGDLVTCEWWNDLWLNEGFASYMELLGGNSTDLDFAAMDRYVVDKFQVAMAYDATPSSVPIHSDEIDIVNSQPSTIVYQKGASLIRTMQGFLSEPTFIGGIRNYLDTHAYNNTGQDDLFASLTAQAVADGTLTNYTVKEVMDTWTRQTGFPIIQVVWFGSFVLVRHEIFSANPPGWEDTPGHQDHPPGTWLTPIAYTTADNPDFGPESWKPKFWFEPGQHNVSLYGAVSSTEWLIANPDARSYYRVIYCQHFLGLILSQLASDHEAFSPSSRSQMIDDLFKTTLSKGWENAQVRDMMNITQYLGMEDNLAVWMTVFNNFRPINRALIDAPFYQSWKDYILSKVEPVLDRLGWEQGPSDPAKDAILRSGLLDWACSLGSAKCEAVTRDYATELASGTAIPADLQAVLYCKAVSISDSLELPNEFNVKQHLLESYLGASRAERMPLFYNALACDSINYLDSWLTLVTSGDSVFTDAHSISFLQRLADNPANREGILSYFTANIDTIIASLGESAISSVVSSMSAYTWDPSLSAETKTFIDLALEVVTGTPVRNSLTASRTTLDNNLAWFEYFGVKIGNWLN